MSEWERIDHNEGISDVGEKPPATVSVGSKRPEKEVAAKKTKRNTAVKCRRPSNYPRRPLSSYNIYFKEERAKLLAAQRSPGPNSGEKIGFEKMAKTIGKRWKELTEEELERFKKLAQEDTERYRKDMDAYHLDLAMKGRKEREELARRRQEEAGRYQQNGLPSHPAGAVASSLVGLHTSAGDSRGGGGRSMGHLAGSHLSGRLAGRSSSSLSSLPGSRSSTSHMSISAQFNQILSTGTSHPNVLPQGLQGFLAAAQNQPTPLQDAFLLGNLASSQSMTQQARFEDQLRQSLLSRARANQANQELMERQLLAQALAAQGGNGTSGSGVLPEGLAAFVRGSNTRQHKDHAPGPEPGRYLY